MDIYDEALLRFWSVLNQHQVEYIMVGGFATRLHGFNRNTDDIDLWLFDSIENKRKLRYAFKELGYGDFPSIEKMEFVPGWTTFYIAHQLELDIMTTMKGLEDYTFSYCLESASTADFNGVMVPFLHINQLILNKKVVNRPKDQIDVIELEKISKLRENDP